MATRAAETGPAIWAVPLRTAPLAGLSIRPPSLIRVAVLLLVVGNLGRFPIASIGAKDAPILFNDLMVLSVLAAGVVVAFRSRTWRLDSPALLGLAFAAVGCASAVLAIPRFGLSGIELAFSLAYLARWLAYFGIYVVVINTVRPGDVGSLWDGLETMLLVIAGFGIFQSVFLPGFAQLVYPESVPYVDWDPQGHRLVSTILDPNLAGSLIVLGLLVMLGRLSVVVRTRLWKPLVLLTALVLTLSRGSFLSFMIGGIVILVARGLSRRLLKWGALAAVLALPFVPALLGLARTYNRLALTDPSALSRVRDWLRGLAVFADHPVIGIGFNTYGFVQQLYGGQPGGKATFGVAGGLLFIAVMTGLVGLALYAAMVALVLRRSRRIWRDAARPAEHRGLAVGVAAGTVAMLVSSLFTNSLFFPFVMEPLYVLWAMTFVVQPSGEPSAPAPRGPVVVALATARR